MNFFLLNINLDLHRNKFTGLDYGTVNFLFFSLNNWSTSAEYFDRSYELSNDSRKKSTF